MVGMYVHDVEFAAQGVPSVSGRIVRADAQGFTIENPYDKVLQEHLETELIVLWRQVRRVVVADHPL